jgi:hypothetical protein
VVNVDPMDVFGIIVAAVAGVALVLVLWHRGRRTDGR